MSLAYLTDYYDNEKETMRGGLHTRGACHCARRQLEKPVPRGHRLLYWIHTWWKTCLKKYEKENVPGGVRFTSAEEPAALAKLLHDCVVCGRRAVVILV